MMMNPVMSLMRSTLVMSVFWCGTERVAVAVQQCDVGCGVAGSGDADGERDLRLAVRRYGDLSEPRCDDFHGVGEG